MGSLDWTVVDDCIVVELKAVERHPVHLAQGITYLKLTGYPAGLLMNFNATTLRAVLKRLDHLASCETACTAETS